MRTPHVELLPLIVEFSSLFSKQDWEPAKVLTLEAVLAIGKRTITACLRVKRPEWIKSSSDYCLKAVIEKSFPTIIKWGQSRDDITSSQKIIGIDSARDLQGEKVAVFHQQSRTCSFCLRAGFKKSKFLRDR